MAYVEVNCGGGKLLLQSDAGEILRSGESRSWHKVANIGIELPPTRKDAFRRITSEEKSSKQHFWIGRLIVAFGIILFGAFKLPHRNDSIIREMEQPLR